METVQLALIQSLVPEPNAPEPKRSDEFSNIIAGKETVAKAESPPGQPPPPDAKTAVEEAGIQEPNARSQKPDFHCGEEEKDQADLISNRTDDPNLSRQVERPENDEPVLFATTFYAQYANVWASLVTASGTTSPNVSLSDLWTGQEMAALPSDTEMPVAIPTTVQRGLMNGGRLADFAGEFPLPAPQPSQTEPAARQMGSSPSSPSAIQGNQGWHPNYGNDASSLVLDFEPLIANAPNGTKVEIKPLNIEGTGKGSTLQPQLLNMQEVPAEQLESLQGVKENKAEPKASSSAAFERSDDDAPIDIQHTGQGKAKPDPMAGFTPQEKAQLSSEEMEGTLGWISPKQVSDQTLTQAGATSVKEVGTPTGTIGSEVAGSPLKEKAVQAKPDGNQEPNTSKEGFTVKGQEPADEGTDKTSLPEDAKPKPASVQTVNTPAQRTETARPAEAPLKAEPLEAHRRASVIRQIVDRVETLAAAHRPGGVLVRLDPQDLGTIILTVKSIGDQIEANIVASDDRVRTALDTSRSHLAQALEAKGFSLKSVAVTEASSTQTQAELSSQNRGQSHQQSRQDQQALRQQSNMWVYAYNAPSSASSQGGFVRSSQAGLDLWT